VKEGLAPLDATAKVPGAGVRKLRILLALLVLPSTVLACKTECSKQSDCNTDGGESCLWPAGVGCGDVKGTCQKKDSCQASAGAPTLLCSCSGTQLALECIPGNGVAEQTTNGTCAADGGVGEAGDAGDAGDASPGDAGGGDATVNDAGSAGED
jgi:hypothetical protein